MPRPLKLTTAKKKVKFFSRQVERLEEALPKREAEYALWREGAESRLEKNRAYLAKAEESLRIASEQAEEKKAARASKKVA